MIYKICENSVCNGVMYMAAKKTKKTRSYRNIDYRFYCRNGSLPLKVVTETVNGVEQQRCVAILKLEASKYLKHNIQRCIHVKIVF